MKMTSRYTAYRSQGQGPTTNLKNMAHGQPSSVSNDDDEFSDFKSGLPISGPSSISTGNRSTHVPLLSSNLLQYTSSPTHYVPPANRTKPSAVLPFPNEVGNRLANYTLGLGSNQDKTESLMGDEDKYSPLRAFLQNEFQSTTTKESQSEQAEKTKTFDEDGDFGDFQSFTQWTPKEDHLTLVPVPTQHIPVSNKVTTFNSHVNQVNLSITTESQPQPNSTLDDFGDFVSFSKGPTTSRFAAPPAGPVLKIEKSTPSIDLFNFDVSVSNKSTSAVAAAAAHPGRTDSLLSGLDADAESSSCRPSFHPDGLAPLKTTLISGPSPTELDPFGDFLTSPTITRRNDPEPQIQPKSKKGTPETMSVCSLDLGNYGAPSWELPDAAVGSKVLVNTPKEVQRSSPLLNNQDKYGAFKEEQDREMDKCVTDWRRVLETCLKLIEEGERVFQSVSSSDILRQVIQTDKGRNYVLGLRQVYLVSSRVYQSWMRLGGNEIVSELHQKLALAWDSIAPFLLGTNLEEDFRRRSPMSEEDAENVCGICLVGTDWREGEEEESWRLSLDFGGTLYHLPCANFWINQIDSMLPTLGVSKNRNIAGQHFQTLI